MRVVYAPTDRHVERTHWRTYAVLGHTFAGSCRVVARALAGRLSAADVDHRVQRWCDHVFRLSKTTVRVWGDQHIDRTQAHVLLSNHVSLLDIPAVCVTYPGRVRFVAKEELRKVPAFGEAMAAAGIVFVDRANRQRAIEQLQQTAELFAEGTSVWIAAEGSRSRDGRLHPFKKGGFHVALHHGLPIVPVWIHGTLDVIPPDQFGSVTGQCVDVFYGEPVPTQGRTTADLAELVAVTRQRMLALARRAGAPADVDAVSP